MVQADLETLSRTEGHELSKLGRTPLTLAMSECFLNLGSVRVFKFLI